MSLKNIQLINAEEVSNLFQIKYDTSSFIRVLTGEKQIDLATATSSINEIILGEKLEIKIGENYTIELNDYQQDIIVELRDLGWGLLLFINEDAYYLRVNQSAQESEFTEIKNYPTLKHVDFGYNEAIKSLDFLYGAELNFISSLNLKACKSLISLEGISTLENLTTLNLAICHSLTSLEGTSSLKKMTSLDLTHNWSKCLEGISELINLTSLNLSWNKLENLNDISSLKNLTFLNLSYNPLRNLEDILSQTKLSSLDLEGCSSLKSIEGISSLTNLTSLNLRNCESLTSLEGVSDLTNLTSLNLCSCKSLTSLEGISVLTNLTSLILSDCISLISMKEISGLINLTSLDLSNCKSLKSLEGISGLTNLTSLNLRSCKSLTSTSIEVISGLTNLTSLDLASCESLISLEGISSLTNLIYLNLSHCISLNSFDRVPNQIQIESLDLFNYNISEKLEEEEEVEFLGLKSLKSIDLSDCIQLKNIDELKKTSNLEKVNLNNCSRLINIDGLIESKNLIELNLSSCSNLVNLDGLKNNSKLEKLQLNHCQALVNLDGMKNLVKLTELDFTECISLKETDILINLINIEKLNFNGCKSLENIDGISNMLKLNFLEIRGCRNLKSIKGINNFINLTSLKLSGNRLLSNLNPIVKLQNLKFLDLSFCSSIVSISCLKELNNLSELYLRNSENIRDFEELLYSKNLRRVEWIHRASCFYVLTGSAVKRKDSLFIEKRIIEWIDNLKFTKIPIAFANELIRAVSLIEKEELAKEQFIHLAKAIRERGMADGDSGNAFTATTWELWVEAVMIQSNGFQEILELTTQNIDSERELEVFTAPILTALADISVRYPSSKEWALSFVKEQLESLVENEDWARTIAPAAAVFYAGMELHEEVTFWLNKGTHPHIPKWKDTILLALATYYAKKADFPIARNYLKNITLPDMQDQGRVLLAKAMCIDFPQEALEEFVKIKDVILQTTLAKQLALEPSILASSEGLYQILLCLEQTPTLFSEFVSNVLEKEPSSQFVQSIEALFAKPTEKSSSATAFLALCNEPTVIENIGKLNLQEFKNELQEEVNKERITLVEDFVSTLIEKELINEKFREKFQHDLTTNL